VKKAEEFYSDHARYSHVFACFDDFSKAFDMVDYWKLFSKLSDDEIDNLIVTLWRSSCSLV
jgi:hypothetical protein